MQNSYVQRFAYALMLNKFILLNTTLNICLYKKSTDENSLFNSLRLCRTCVLSKSFNNLKRLCIFKYTRKVFFEDKRI